MAETLDHDCGHGFITTRQAQLHNVQLSAIDNRWQHSGLRTLVVMNSETFNQTSQKTSNETAYYLSNHPNDSKQYTVKTLASAIRGHWSVESNNWQLDVTFGEDRVQVENGNQAQIMGKLRCFAMNLMRWSKTGTQNFQATIEKFTDSPEALVSMIEQVNFFMRKPCLFLTVLAYQFVQIIRKTAARTRHPGRWSSLREILSLQQRVTASFQHADGGALHIRKATRPETELTAIYQALNLDPLPGGVQKTYV